MLLQSDCNENTGGLFAFEEDAGRQTSQEYVARRVARATMSLNSDWRRKRPFFTFSLTHSILRAQLVTRPLVLHLENYFLFINTLVITFNAKLGTEWKYEGVR
jgi:hypothetical protein